jgi:hypothetical protein
MTNWKIHAEAALVDLTSALTGISINAAAALDDALSNLNRAIGALDSEGTPEPEPDADCLEEQK